MAADGTCTFASPIHQLPRTPKNARLYELLAAALETMLPMFAELGYVAFAANIAPLDPALGFAGCFDIVIEFLGFSDTPFVRDRRCSSKVERVKLVVIVVVVIDLRACGCAEGRRDEWQCKVVPLRAVQTAVCDQSAILQPETWRTIRWPLASRRRVVS